MERQEEGPDGSTRQGQGNRTEGRRPREGRSAAASCAATTFRKGTDTLDVDGVIGDYLIITFKRAVGHDEVSGVVEASSDLTTWGPAVLVPSPTYNGDGTETVIFRHPQPRNANPQQFLRLRATRL